MAQRGITPQFMMQSYRKYLHKKLRSQRQLQAETEMAASQNSNNTKSASSLVTLWKNATFSNCQTAEYTGPSLRWMFLITYLRAISSNNKVQPAWICWQPEIFQVMTLQKPVRHSDSRSLQWTNKTGNMAFREEGDSTPFIFISWCFVRSSMLFQAESEKASHYLPVSMGQHRFWCKTTGRRHYPADSIAAQYDLYMEHNQ